MDDKFILNELRNLILNKIGMKSISPSDCKKISAEITKELGKNVSETTIKRLFGFAKIEHKFSRFTLTTLLEYVEKEHLIKTLPKSSVSSQQADHVNEWIMTRDQARRVAELTIKGIKHRSGLPYHLTVQRKFAEKDFEDFFDSDNSFMAFISQPGYGRTISLCHLAEKYFLRADSVYQNAVFLFINISSLFNNEYKSFDLEEHIKAQLGISPLEGIISFVDRHQETHDGQFILFLDGFTELALKREIKFQLFESIINFLSTLEETSNIKLVLNMRATTWSRFYEHIRHSAVLRSRWFRGNYFNDSDCSNVPLLTEREFNQVLLNINGKEDLMIHESLKHQLKYPYHLQLYYQLKEEDPNFDHSSTCASYEIITKFIQEKIYRSNYYTEKILFLKKLVQLTGYAKKDWSVAKDDLIHELSAFKNAYMELISSGILVEEKQTLKGHPREYVRFIQVHIFEYFLFIELLEKSHLQLDRSFFMQVVTNYQETNLAFSLLKWSIRFVIRTGDIKVLNVIFELKISSEEKNQLILFTAENLKYMLQSSMELLVLLHKQKFHHNAVTYFLGSDVLDPTNQKSVRQLLEIVDTNEHRLFYQSILFVKEALELDTGKVVARMEQMEELKTTASSWPFNTYDVAWLIHQKLKNIPVDQHPILEQLELFKQDHTTLSIINTPAGNQELLIYMNMLLVNFFYGSPEEQIKIIQSILKAHPGIFLKRESPFSAHLLVLLALACAKTPPGKKTLQLESILEMLFADRKGSIQTENTLAVYKIFKAKQGRNTGDYDLAIDHATESLDFFKRTGLNSVCLILYNLVIQIYTLKQDFEKTNELKYEKYSYIEERNLPKHLFPLPAHPHDVS